MLVQSSRCSFALQLCFVAVISWNHTFWSAGFVARALIRKCGNFRSQHSEINIEHITFRDV